MVKKFVVDFRHMPLRNVRHVSFFRKDQEREYMLIAVEPYVRKDGRLVSLLVWEGKCMKCGVTFYTKSPLRGRLGRHCPEHARKAMFHYMAVLRGRKKAKAIRAGTYKPTKKKEIPHKVGFRWNSKQKVYKKILKPVRLAKSIDDLL